ncbi:SCO family protein [Marinomonas piezotolerans]|uniref:SCO family protein n=1 Tax=Marinomonas piezotolerans TaxID=2213058 RepID=A0A370U6F0_9GAMM|nr:SCO family protein [Marinomonas piezotolerans]RDL43357.1 SCO family protein [Marinomonas piezotolerans]
MKLKPVTLFAMLAVLAIAGTLLALQGPSSKDTKQSPDKLGGDFVLYSKAGPVSLSDYPDKLKLMFFGYTHCPDVCPLTLANVKVALKQLPDNLRDQVQVIFVSVDPMRDTPDHLSQYVQFFDPSFVGVTGSKEEIDQVVRQYGAFYRIESSEGSDYTVSHSARLYLIGKDNEIKQYLYHDSQSEEIAEAIKELL